MWVQTPINRLIIGLAERSVLKGLAFSTRTPCPNIRIISMVTIWASRLQDHRYSKRTIAQLKKFQTIATLPKAEWATRKRLFLVNRGQRQETSIQLWKCLGTSSSHRSCQTSRAKNQWFLVKQMSEDSMKITPRRVATNQLSQRIARPLIQNKQLASEMEARVTLLWATSVKSVTCTTSKPFQVLVHPTLSKDWGTSHSRSTRKMRKIRVSSTKLTS